MDWCRWNEHHHHTSSQIASTEKHRFQLYKSVNRIDTHLRHLRADRWCAWTHFPAYWYSIRCKISLQSMHYSCLECFLRILEDMLPYKRLTPLYDTRLSTFTGSNYYSRFLTLSKIGWNSMDFAAASRHLFPHPASTPPHQPIPDLWQLLQFPVMFLKAMMIQPSVIGWTVKESPGWSPSRVQRGLRVQAMEVELQILGHSRHCERRSSSRSAQTVGRLINCHLTCGGNLGLRFC